jgi:hypothetical protein
MLIHGFDTLRKLNMNADTITCNVADPPNDTSDLNSVRSHPGSVKYGTHGRGDLLSQRFSYVSPLPHRTTTPSHHTTPIMVLSDERTANAYIVTDHDGHHTFGILSHVWDSVPSIADDGRCRRLGPMPESPLRRVVSSSRMEIGDIRCVGHPPDALTSYADRSEERKPRSQRSATLPSSNQ